jgi:hypothetical protein
MTKPIFLSYELLDEYVASLKDTLLDERHYDPKRLYCGEDVDVFKPDGSLLGLLRRKAIPEEVCDRPFPALLRAAKPSLNRGGKRHRRVKRDGTISNTLETPPVLSGLIGYYDRSAREPYCRETEFVQNDRDGWAYLQPLIREIDKVFKREAPEQYATYLATINKTCRSFVVTPTVFTTGSVNRNARFPAHRDKGNLKGAFGAMAVFARGVYFGCYLVFPKYRVAFDVRNRDLLIADTSGEFHGNTAFEPAEGDYTRVSMVMYARAGIVHCGTPAEEVERAKRRKRGDRLR